MNRKILIPILLSTFLLVGCETETEFDRCLETNLDLDLEQFLEKIKSYQKKLTESEKRLIAVGDMAYFISNNWEDNLTSIERTFNSCLVGKLRDKGPYLDNLDYDEFGAMRYMEQKQQAVEYRYSWVEDCLAKDRERATKVCHSQGIY